MDRGAEQGKESLSSFSDLSAATIRDEALSGLRMIDQDALGNQIAVYYSRIQRE